MRKVALIVLLLGCVAPLALSLGYGLMYSLGLIGLQSEGFTLSFWAQLLSGEFARSIIYSAYVAGASTVLALGAALALLFSCRLHLRRALPYRLLFLPLTVPPLVAAFVVFQLLSGGGVLARAAWHFGLISDTQAFPELVHDPYGVGIIIAHGFLVFPFFLLVLLNIWDNEQLDELGRVAASLGVAKHRVFARIHLPLLMRGIFPLLALYVIFFMGAYDIPLVLGQSSPRMISVLVLEKLQRFNLADIPVAYAMASWYALLCIATIALLFTRFKRRYSL